MNFIFRRRQMRRKDWIKLFRQIQQNEFYFSERFTKMGAWMDLLILATHSGNTANIRNIEIKLKPGELCYSIKTLAERWKWNERTVSKVLRMFQDREMITYKTYKIKNAKITTVINILKWDEYQRGNIQPFKSQKHTVQENSINTRDKGTKKKKNTLQSTVQSTYNQECKKKDEEEKEFSSYVFSLVTVLSKRLWLPEMEIQRFILKVLTYREDLANYQKALLLLRLIKDIPESMNKIQGYLLNKFRESNYKQYIQNEIEFKKLNSAFIYKHKSLPYD